MIDIHTHFFNLKYLPVAGIIRRYSRNLVPHVIAIGVESLLLRGTKSSLPVEGEEIISFTSAKPILMSLEKKLPDGGDKSPLLLTTGESINKLLNTITEDDIKDELLLNAIDAFQAIELAEGNQIAILEVDIFLKKNVSLTEAEEAVNVIGRLLHWIAKKLEQGIDYIKWFVFMQHSEDALVEYLSTRDEPGVDLFVHHSMAVDNFFNRSNVPGRYRSSFGNDLQIRKMEKLNKKYPGKLIGFVAFDPSNPEGLEIVKTAINKNGFKGVKFYPPMGYNPFEDENYAARIGQLFDYCIDKDLPIFTHCNNQGFEAYPKLHSGHKSNPMNWKKVLAQKKYNDLRLCLGHAGGVEGWFCEASPDEEVDPLLIKDLPEGIDEKQGNWNSSYAKIVYKLCHDHPNVYCDAAYLDDITEEKKRDYFKARLLRLFTACPGFSKKIIYGSDWHMLFQEGKNARYMKDYVELFNDGGFTEENRNDFFSGNARSYLKM